MTRFLVPFSVVILEVRVDWSDFIGFCCNTVGNEDNCMWFTYIVTGRGQSFIGGAMTGDYQSHHRIEGGGRYIP